MNKREALEPTPSDKRYVRRGKDGEIVESDDLNRSLSGDDRKTAKKTAKPGDGDHGDGHTGNREFAK